MWISSKSNQMLTVATWFQLLEFLGQLGSITVIITWLLRDISTQFKWNNPLASISSAIREPVPSKKKPDDSANEKHRHYNDGDGIFHLFFVRFLVFSTQLCFLACGRGKILHRVVQSLAFISPHSSGIQFLFSTSMRNIPWSPIAHCKHPNLLSIQPEEVGL